LVSAFFGFIGLIWLALALFGNNPDPYTWLRFLVPALWFFGAVVAAIRARRADRQ
jgi:hypothetical protein